MKMLTKQECEKALEILQEKYLNLDVVDELICFKRLMKEHFELIEKIKKIQDKFGVIPIEDILYAMLKDDASSENQWFPVLKKFRILTGDECDKLANYENPQTYKLEDLKPNMWLFDLKDAKCKKIESIYRDFNNNITIIGFDDYDEELFEENRFYPVTKALQYQVGVD